MDVQLTPWSPTDLPLERRFNTQAMKAHLGGLEPDDAIVARHERFLALPASGAGQMFKITADTADAGAVGYWSRDDEGYELGWNVLPEFQGRGVASTAVLATLTHARTAGARRYADAFPSVTNVASNALCRRTGFTLVAELDFEYPKGHPMRCNHWRVDLSG
jgi:RimJ/RimL family protein N-acetyltransferase